MSRKYVLIGVEGNHDQAFVGRVLRKLLKFSTYDTLTLDDLEPKSLWRKFVPEYPGKTKRLHVMNKMPSILYKDTVTDSLSVAIYSGEGSNLSTNLKDFFSNNLDYREELFAFAIIADADKEAPDRVARKYHEELQEYFPNFPTEVNINGKVEVQEGYPRVGLYILPNNVDQGVLDTLLCACGEVAYPEHMKRARDYIEKFSETEIRHWKPFDREKATIAAVASILKPGKTNTTTISDDKWVSPESAQQIPQLKNLTDFFKELLQLETIA